MEQRSPEFKEGSHEVARVLGLVPEWWTGNNVLDRSDGPCCPERYVARDDWHRCRAVRHALLEALKRTGQKLRR